MAKRMGKGGIVVHIGTEYTDKDIKRAQADLRRLEGSAKTTTTGMSKFGSTMQNAVGRNLYSVQTALAGAVAGMGAFALSMAVEGVQSAAAEEQQLAKLKSALDNVNQGFALDSITAFIDKMMYATNVADDELRPAFQTLVTATRDAAKAQDLLSLAVDISVAKNKSLASVSTALSKAANGQTTALTRLGVPLSENARAAGGFDIAIQELQATFTGAAAAAADTFAGRLANLQIVFDETKEAFGTGFLEGIESSLGGLGTLGDAFVGLQPHVENLGRELGIVTGQVIILTAELSKIRESLGPIAEFINPIQGLANMFTVLGLGIEAAKDSLDILPQSGDAASASMRNLAGSDFTNLNTNLGIVNDNLNTVTRPREMSIVLRTFFEAGQVGISPDLTRILDDYFEGLKDEIEGGASDVAAAAKKVDPFKAWTDSLAEEGRKLVARARLVAKGIPAAMADGILSDPGWQRIVKGVMGAGAAAVRTYVEQWSKAPDGIAAIGERVDAIVEAARTRLGRLRESEREFRDIQKGFADIATDFGKVTTVDTSLPITAETITDNLRQRLASVREFSRALGELQERGLGPTALTDIIRLGPFEGLQYAKAILEGGQVTVDTIANLSTQFQAPADVIGRIGAEAVTGTTMGALQAAQTFTVQAGAVQITVNGEVTAATTRQIREAVTQAFTDVGREARTRGRTGVR